MKTLLLFLLCVCSQYSAYCAAGDENEIKGVYRWNTEKEMRVCNMDGSFPSGNAVIKYSYANQRFYIVRVISDSVVIRIADYTANDEKTIS